ncbi:MAG TPA: NAD(P)-dependent oxidoreductase [Phototrophicaceae bacterium]|nr:NAD(P)-dependent oxidoreductase [Phototrophicaceae bacterium]
MKLALFGGTGRIGTRIAQEALARGHEVTVMVRNAARLTYNHRNLTIIRGNVLDPANIAKTAANADAAISAIGPVDGDPSILISSAQAIIDGLNRAGVKRLVVVGGAGSLETASGVLVMDTPTFPAAWKPVAQAHQDALGVYRESNLDWTFFSPAALIEPGERTGKYRTGTDQLVTDADGKSLISMEDYAVALLDEVEKPRFIRQRFTAAY